MIGLLDYFALGGPLSRMLGDGYEPRQQQIDLSTRIAEVVQEGGALFAEGPCGSGKGQAYLAPVVLEGKSAVIATANIALQGQLLKKDLPLIRRALGDRQITYALLKGRRNYLCRWRLNDKKNAKERLVDWAATTVTGDKADVSFELFDGEWERVSSSADECFGRDCRFYDRCFANAARAIALKARIMVTNHMMLGLSVKIPDLLGPSRDVLIVDEAHEFEGWLRKALGNEITVRAFTKIIKDMRKLDLIGTGDVDVDDDDVFDVWIYEEEKANRFEERARAFFTELLDNVRSEITRFVAPVKGLRTLEPLLESLDQLIEELSAFCEDCDDVNRDGVRRVVGWLVRRAERLAAILHECFVQNSGSTVTWLTRKTTRRGVPYVVLNCAPIDVSKQSAGVLGRYQAAVLTSATLRAGGSFSLLQSSLGMLQSATFTVSSPFDFKRQCALVIPHSMPKPPKSSGMEKKVSPQRFYEAVAKHLLAVCLECPDGGVLGLFTSKASLAVSAEYLMRQLRGRRTVFVQRDGMSRDELVACFKDDITSILLGVASFWTGVDVPGQALCAVVIDKLPFVSPEDPVEQAVCEMIQARGGGTFRERALPKATLALRQGFGRLIRSRDDYGVVVVLDRRLERGGSNYWQYMRNSLPGTQFSDQIQDVGRLIEETGRG